MKEYTGEIYCGLPKREQEVTGLSKELRSNVGHSLFFDN